MDPRFTRSQPKRSRARNPDSRKKAKMPFGGQGAPENVPHETGIGGPIGAELELHHDAGGHPDGEDEAEDPGPKLAISR